MGTMTNTVKMIAMFAADQPHPSAFSAASGPTSPEIPKPAEIGVPEIPKAPPIAPQGHGCES